MTGFSNLILRQLVARPLLLMPSASVDPKPAFVSGKPAIRRPWLRAKADVSRFEIV